MTIINSLQKVWHKPLLQRGFRFSFAFLILAVLFTHVDLFQVLQSFRAFELWLLLPIMLSLFLMYFIQAYQTSFGLKPLGMEVSVFRLFQINLIASFYGLFLSTSLAGSITWYKLANISKKSLEAGVLIVYFRLLNTLFVLLIGTLGIWFNLRSVSLSFVFILIFLVISGFIAISPFFLPSVARLFEHLAKRFLLSWSIPVWIHSNGEKLWQAIISFHTLPVHIIVCSWSLSLFLNLVALLHVIFCAWAVGISQPVYVIGWVYVIVYIASLFPISIGGLGVREVSIVVLLSNYGVAEAQALSLSLSIFSFGVVVSVVGGLLEAWDVLSVKKTKKPNSAQAQQPSGKYLVQEKPSEGNST